MIDFVLNFLYPPVCGICGKINYNWICSKCEKRLQKYEKFEIIKGNKNIKNILKNNKEEIYFDELLYYFEYKGLIRKLLLQYKFSDGSYLANFWAKVILKNKKIDEIFRIYDIMIPVPMHYEKELMRGYNQTKLVTDIISKQNKILVESNILIKNKKTETQSTLNLEKRYKNVKNVFEIKKVDKIENKTIILFDDICTTGATVNEISRILKKAGARKILVLVIAKD